MDLTLSPEQEAVRDAIRGVLADRQPTARVRQVMTVDPPVDEALWREAAALGWFGLALPETAGGAGYGLPEAMLLFQELGRGVIPGPWLGTVLAARALAARPGGHPALDGLLVGRRRVAVVDDPEDQLGKGARLEGAAHAVVDAGCCDALLVLGRETSRLVECEARGVRIEGGPSVDPTRRIGTVTFAGVDAVQDLDDLGDARRWRLEGTVLAAAEALGVAERTVEMSVEYGKVRQQFGKPIGTFQAIKHRCADMAVRTEVARSSVTYAAVALAEGEPSVARHVAMAKTLASNAALINATDNIQNHGGMGYTWESDAHLYLKRARLLEHCFGTRTAHLDTLAAPWRAAR
jgi:alkylation response protein AidB-like acyl-CoA dehydrogenase